MGNFSEKLAQQLFEMGLPVAFLQKKFDQFDATFDFTTIWGSYHKTFTVGVDAFANELFNATPGNTN